MHLLFLLLGPALAQDAPPDEAPPAAEAPVADGDVPPEASDAEVPDGETEPEPEPERIVIELPPVELDDEDSALPSVMTTFDEEDRTLLNHQFGGRPQAGLLVATDPQTGVGARLGGDITHRWWTVPRTGIVWSGETSIGAAGVVGDLKGWDAHVRTVAGPWLGPVALRLGPFMRGDSLGSPKRTVTLDEAFLVGFDGGITVDTKPVTVWAGAAPTWVVAGARQAAGLPGVTELDVTAGIAGRVPINPLLNAKIGVGTRTRFTAMGPIVDIHLILNLDVSAEP